MYLYNYAVHKYLSNCITLIDSSALEIALFLEIAAAVAAAKSLQSCPTLCDPIDGSPPGSCPWDSPGKNPGVGCHFLLQLWKWKVKVKSLSHVPLFTTPWTAAYQAPPSMGFSRQEYWSGVPLPSPRFSLIIHFIHSNIYIYMSIPNPQFILEQWFASCRLTSDSVSLQSRKYLEIVLWF